VAHQHQYGPLEILFVAENRRLAGSDAPADRFRFVVEFQVVEVRHGLPNDEAFPLQVLVVKNRDLVVGLPLLLGFLFVSRSGLGRRSDESSKNNKKAGSGMQGHGLMLPRDEHKGNSEAMAWGTVDNYFASI